MGNADTVRQLLEGSDTELLEPALNAVIAAEGQALDAIEDALIDYVKQADGLGDWKVRSLAPLMAMAFERCGTVEGRDAWLAAVASDSHETANHLTALFTPDEPSGWEYTREDLAGDIGKAVGAAVGVVTKSVPLGIVAYIATRELAEAVLERREGPPPDPPSSTKPEREIIRDMHPK